MAAHEFKTVEFVAEHVPEEHYGPRDQGREHMGTLPGLVNLYAVIDGGKVLLDQLKAPVVFEAMERAQKERDAAAAEQAEADAASQAAQQQERDAAAAEQAEADAASQAAQQQQSATGTTGQQQQTTAGQQPAPIVGTPAGPPQS